MDKHEFLKQEYISLREEITQTKARIFKLCSIGILGLPAGYFLAKTHDIEILILSLPVLIVVVTLLFLAESQSLMRCGSYIKDNIEKYIIDEKDNAIQGWENWLENKDTGPSGKRIVDQLVAISFYLLFFIYYLASVHLAAKSAKNCYGILCQAVVLGIYAGLGILLAYVLIKFFVSSTCTSKECIDISQLKK